MTLLDVLLASGDAPLGFRTQDHVHLGAVDGVGVGADLAAADAADDLADLGNRQQPALDDLRRPLALRQRDRGRHRQADDDGPLAQLGRELRAEARKHRCAGHHQNHRDCDSRPATPDEELDHGPIRLQEPAYHQGFTVAVGVMAPAARISMLLSVGASSRAKMSDPNMAMATV